MKKTSLIIIIILALIVGGYFIYRTLDKTKEPLIGGQRDEHGCLGSAGYTWCEAKEKCLREWEEPCTEAEAFNMLIDIKEATKINFSGITKTELNWATAEGDIKATGKGFDATRITSEELRSIGQYLIDKGFVVDVYNVIAGTIAGSTGYRLNNMSVIVAGGATGYKEAEGQWIPPEPDLKDVTVSAALIEVDETASWQTYENKKYGYELKYPKNCLTGPLPGYCKQSPPEERPQECRCFLDPTNPDSVMMQAFTGAKSDLNMASVSILRSPNKDYNPPVGVNLIEWLKGRYEHLDIPDEYNTKIDGVEAIKAYTPQSPGAHSAENIFFLHKGELLQIYLNGVDNKDNREFYDKVLASITLN